MIKREGGNFWNWWICLWQKLWWWFHGCIFISKLIKLYTLIMYSFMYVHCTSIKCYLKKKNTLEMRPAVCVSDACSSLENCYVVIYLPYDPVISLLGIWQKKYKHVSTKKKKLYKNVHVILFTIAKHWKQPKCPPAE